MTTDWKGCRDTVEHGKNGFLVKPNDTTSLIEALDQLAVCELQTLSRFGAQSRRIAEQRFDERLVLQAYQNAVNGQRRLQSA